MMRDRRRTGGLASLFLLIVAISFLATFGCGGGGGGDGGSIQYTGVTTQATVDSTNADDLAQGAYSGGTAGSAMTLGFGTVSQGGVDDRPRYLNLARTLKDAISQVDVYAPEGIVEAGTIIQESDSFPGDCGGSAVYVISLNDQTGEFSGSLTFYDFCSDGVFISGSARFSGDFDEVSSEFVEFTITTSGLTVISGGDSFTTSGYLSFNFQTSPLTVSADLKLRDNSTMEVCWAHNYSMTVVEDPAYEEITYSGTFYHPDYGYVVVSTSPAFHIDIADTWPSAGVLEVSGVGGSKARLTAEPTFQYRVEADTDGDGFFDDYDSGLMDW